MTANRYCDLGAGNDNISDSFGEITDGFTAAQKDIDANDGDIASLQQQITTEQQQRIAADTAHANSTTAHAADHLVYESGKSVKQKIGEQDVRIDTILQGGGPNKDAELVDIRTGADGVARATAGTLVREIHAKQLAAASQKEPITHGLNYIASDTASDADVVVKGVTRVNLLGKDGYGTNVSVGGGTVTDNGDGTFTFNTDGSSFASLYVPFNTNLIQSGKYYLVGVKAKAVSGTNIKFGVADANGYDNYTQQALSTELQINFMKQTGDTLLTKGSIAINNLNQGDFSVEFEDGFYLYEISADEYAYPHTQSEIEAEYGYVDSVQHLKNPILTVSGKNLFNKYARSVDFYVDITNGILFSNATTDVSEYIPVKSGQSYFYGEVNGYALYDANKVYLTGASANTFTPTKDGYVRVTLLKEFVDTFQLELGSTSTTYQKYNPSYLYGVKDSAGNPIKLASNVDGTVRDMMYEQDGQWYALRQFKLDVALDGNLNWVFGADYAGFKEIKISSFIQTPTTTSATITKYDGKILTPNSAAVDGFSYSANTLSTLFVEVSDADTGWTETLNPNDNAAKAAMNGWKANANDGSTYTSWESILDGSAPATNTEAYVAANKAPGWTAWGTLDYQLAQTGEPEAVQVEGSLSLVEGGNAVSLGEGVIVREPVTPYNFNAFCYVNTIYTGFPTSNYFDNRADKILAIYKDGVIDNKWTISGQDANGNARAFIAVEDYDPTAKYTTTYLPLDKYSMTANAVDATVKYQTSDHSVMAQMVAKMADLETGLSIMQILYLRQQAEIDALEG